MKVCVVGSGGREHAFVETLSRDAEVIITPGSLAVPESTDKPPIEVDADLFVIGPEIPLVDGLADELRLRGHKVFGPGSDGALLEGSKAWMKDVVHAAGVPTARYGSFESSQVDRAIEFLSSMSPPFVIKTDGLAGGKGVLVTDNYSDAKADIETKLAGLSFGDAGRRVIIEEGLRGPELSLFAICDGRKAVLVPTSAQDHKRLGNGDLGPNTGGMGCYSPIPEIQRSQLDDLMEIAVHPTVEELKNRNIDYRGVLFAGFMMTEDGPKLLEFNVRFGDPEAQVILPRLRGNFAEILMEAAEGNLSTVPTVDDDAMVTVVLASEGYPSKPITGHVILGVDAALAIDGASVYFAGVDKNENGELITNGGRVLNVCGRASSLEKARAIAYQAVELISWEGMQYRTDIGASVQMEID